MSELATLDSDRFIKMEQVASLRLEGLSETAIGKRLEIPRKVVIELFDEWKQMVNNDTLARDAARDHLNQMVRHYDRLINESYSLLSDLKSEPFTHQIAAQINATLKNIADYESRRVDALQKAGMLDANDLGDELAEREEREAIIIDILRNELCAHCRATVAQKLQQVTKTVEATVVYDEE